MENNEEIIEEEFEDKLYYKVERKIVGWGAIKKYPIILSFLIAIIVPFLGLFFVGNQVDLREIEGKKLTFILGLSLLISLLWWGAIIAVLFIVF